MIRIGIVGCGRILAAHLQGYRLLREAGVDDFRITALCARRLDDAQMYVQRGKGPPQRPAVSGIPGDPLAIGDQFLSDFQDDTDVQLYTDYRKMIAEGPIDAVNDFTLHTLHHEIAAKSFEHGKHLLTQKPLAISIEAARRMCDHAEAKGLTFGVFENARNRPVTRHLHWLFHHSDVCGRLQMVLLGIVGAWWAPDRIVAETPWRHRLDRAGGLTLDIGVHQANMIRYIAGEIVNVDGRVAILEPTRVTLDASGNIVEQVHCEADDTFFATFETQSGVVGNICTSWAGHGEKTLLGEGAVFYGSRGRVTGNNVTLDQGDNRQLSELYGDGSDAAHVAKCFPLGLSDSFALNQHDWLEAIRQGNEPETSGREGLRDLAVAYSILESANARRRVEVAEVLDGQLRTFQRPIDHAFGLA